MSISNSENPYEYRPSDENAVTDWEIFDDEDDQPREADVTCFCEGFLKSRNYRLWLSNDVLHVEEIETGDAYEFDRSTAGSKVLKTGFFKNMVLMCLPGHFKKELRIFTSTFPRNGTIEIAKIIAWAKYDYSNEQEKIDIIKLICTKFFTISTIKFCMVHLVILFICCSPLVSDMWRIQVVFQLTTLLIGSISIFLMLLNKPIGAVLLIPMSLFMAFGGPISAALTGSLNLNAPIFIMLNVIPNLFMAFVYWNLCKDFKQTIRNCEKL